MIVVDANVAVKWFVREPGWENAEQVAAYASIAAPAHLVVEVGRALLRNLRAGTIVPEAATSALRGLPAAVTLVPTEDLIEIALASSVTIYDALYVAAAVRQDCDLITADTRLITALQTTAWRRHAVHLTSWAATHPGGF